MARRRDYADDDDVAEITSLAPSIPNNTLLATYGGRMNIFGGTRDVWSPRVGADNMQYIHADSVANFNVRGQLPMSRLSAGRRYKGVFELELTSRASGWQGQFSVTVTVPGSRRTIRPLNYTCDRPGTFRLCSDTFQLAAPQRNANLAFALSHAGQFRKSGLIVKRFLIQEA